MSIKQLNYQIEEGAVITMDGAMGTELHSRGIKLHPRTWSAEALATEAGQRVIVDIHKASIAAGSKIIITNTFRTNWLGDSAEEAALLACKLAQQARDETGAYDVAIAGSIGPVADCYSPKATPDNGILRKHHKEQVKWLKRGNVDFIIVETMPTIREAVIAAQAATDADLPVSVSFCCKHNKGTLLLSREPLENAVKAITDIQGVTLVSLGVNCVTPATATQAVECLCAMDIKGNPPISVYAQGIDESSPVHDEGVLDPYEHYLVQVDKWLKAGARIIGGCCGVPPGWIETIAQKIERKNNEQIDVDVPMIPKISNRAVYQE